MHTPAVQPLAQALDAGIQAVPPGLQVSTVEPSQRVTPGVHGASQRPLVHVEGQLEV